MMRNSFVPRAWRHGRRAGYHALAAVLLGLLVACGGRDTPPSAAGPPGAPLPVVRRITTITEDGGRVAWSHRLNRIAFDRAGEDGYYDIYTMNPDGSMVACITCNRPGVPTRHNGQPGWHPDGTFIVFQGQKQGVTGPVIDGFAKPGAGVNNDLWITDTEGRNAWRLAEVPAGQGGVLHPHFSRQGDRLLWTERLGPGGRFGEWAIKLADFRVTGGVPRLENIRTFQPGAQRRFYETHGFTPDGRQIYFSGNLEAGQDEIHLDIYRMDIETGALVNLTPGAAVWDEHAQLSPSGNLIVWMSSRGAINPSDPLELRTDFWLMNADGSGQARLTFFNQSGRGEFISSGATAADSDWSPDGSRIIAYIILDNRAQTGRIVMIELGSAQAPALRPGPIYDEPAADASPDPVTAASTRRAAWRSDSARLVEAAQPVAASGDSDDHRSNAARSDAPGSLASVARGELVQVMPRTPYELAWWDTRLTQMVRNGEIRRIDTVSDTVLARRWHERYEQVHHGVPVFGAGATRQTDGLRTMSLFGSVYQGIDVDTVPRLFPDEARAALEQLTHTTLGPASPITLTILPRDDGTFALTYMARVAFPTALMVHFLDARTGDLVSTLDDLRPHRSMRPAAPSFSTGPRAQTTVVAGRARTLDTSRQPGILTFDMGGSLPATLAALNGARALSWSDLGEADAASAAIDVHTLAARTYDYLLRRFGQQGIGGSLPIVHLIHPLGRGAYPGAVEAVFRRSAFYAGRGVIVYGDDAVTSDIVAHEIGHALLDVSSRLAYRGESAALQEAFADFLAAGVEREADGGEPHRSHWPVPRIDAGIPGQAFHLAVEGGGPASAGVRVQGVGPARADEIERAIFRALVWMLPPQATFSMAREAILQAARDLYGRGSAAERALADAWTAVGVH